MHIAIISNVTNGIGLEKDAKLLARFLSGHQVTLVQWDQAPTSDLGTFDLAIWLEVINEHLIPIARRHYLFANPEWLKPEFVRSIQRHCAHVFAKTREAERVLRERFSGVVYTGFLTEDHRVTNVEKEKKCLHIGGNSGFRNTQNVIAAWREYRYWNEDALPDLSVVTTSTTVSCEPTPGVTFHKRITDNELVHLQNSHLFHLYPSAYEGFGQALHEAESVGAVILTTDAAPMNEIPAPFLVPSVRSRKNNFGTLHEVDPVAIREAVPRMAALPLEQLARMSCEARARFERGNKEFEKAFRPFVDETKINLDDHKLKIVMLGNFDAPYSTENDWAWSFESLGHKVIRFQENRDTVEEIIKNCVNVDLFFFVHTHQWITPGKMTVGALISWLRLRGIKTVSAHLDLYFGLNAGDGRESRVGEHAFFWTDYVFTADGSSQEKFEAKSVRHHWLPPACVARDCVPGTFRKEFETEIAFVGARGYHIEYGFREELISTLEQVYGDRFKVLTGFRGQQLNDLYASTKILIGDCCFSGKPFYWSDRLAESAGRGGFILHPQIEGMCIPTATYRPQDVHDLIEKVDYYLEHEDERELIRRAAHEHVKAHDTYTHRVKQILKTVGL